MTTTLAFTLLMNKTPMQLFVAGGIVMWPMILLSFVALTVVIERVLFAIIEKGRRNPEVVHEILIKVEAGDIDGAIAAGNTLPHPAATAATVKRPKTLNFSVSMSVYSP